MREKLLAALPEGSAPDAHAMVDEVLARLPERAEAPSARPASPLSVWVLVAANLLPLYGVLALGWEVLPLLILFWMENVVVGLLNAARMLLADPSDPALWLAKLLYVPFFCVHYGLFAAVHGMFVMSGMFGGEARGTQGLNVVPVAWAAARDYGLWLPMAALAASHLFSFCWNYLYRGEYRRAELSELMTQPYARVVILHATILVGGMAALALGSPAWVLAVLVAIKIGVDVAAHRREHRISA